MDAFQNSLAAAVAAVFPGRPAGPLGEWGARVHFDGGLQLDIDLSDLAAETRGWPPYVVRARIVAEVRNRGVAAGVIPPDSTLVPPGKDGFTLPVTFPPTHVSPPPAASNAWPARRPDQFGGPPPAPPGSGTPQPGGSAEPARSASGEPAREEEGAASGPDVSSKPAHQPSNQPTNQPNSQPTNQPAHQPSNQPVNQPAAPPSSQPGPQPNPQPTNQPSPQPAGGKTAPGTSVPWDRLVPVIRPSGVIYAIAEASRLVRRPISNFLVEFVAVRTPQGTLEFVGQPELSAWGTDAATVIEAARKNLAAVQPVPRRLHMGRTGLTALFATQPEGFESSWIVAPDEMRRAAAQEIYGATNVVPILLFVPTRTTAFVVPRDDDRMVGAALDTALELYMEDSGALSPVPYELAGTQVRGWKPPAGSALEAKVRRARGRIAADEYGMQQGFFDSTDVGHRWCEREKLNPLRPRQSAGGTMSVRVTPADFEGATPLLPEVDKVEFLPAGQAAVVVGWDALVAELQPRVYPGVHPRRFIIEQWPGDDRLDSLAGAGGD